MTTESPTDHGTWIRETMETYEGPLVRYAMRITGELESARDAVQDTFLKLCREDHDKVGTHLAPWLFTVCRNRALDMKRKDSRMQPLSDFHLDTCHSGDPSPAQEASTRESASQVFKLMERLPQNQQEVVRLKFQNGLSYKEISEVTQLSVTNVGFLLHTAIKTLRENLLSEPGVAPGGPL